MKRTTAALAFLAGIPLSAQSTQSYYVSPPGTESVEGNSSSNISFSYASSRVQQVDNSLVGTRLASIRAIAWRRNANLVALTTHTVEIQVNMGHSDYATVGATFASNYKGPPTAVFPKQKLVLDWTSPAQLRPAEYDLVFPFVSPFVYNRTDALLWETVTTTGGANRTDYTQDWYTGSPPSTVHGPRPSPLGSGCTTPNGTMTLGSSFRSSSSTSFEYGFELTGGPANRGTLLLAGMAPVSAPLFCGTLRVDPLLFVPIGGTSPSGAIPLRYAAIAWNASMADADLFTQALALDASQASGIAMSNGLHSRGPRIPGGAGMYTIKRTYHASDASATTGSTPTLSAVATMFLQ